MPKKTLAEQISNPADQAENDEAKEKIDEKHFFDGFIDVRVIPEFCLVIFASIEGDVKTVSFDDNFFSPSDLIKAYKDLWRTSWGWYEADDCLKAYKDYLVACGVNPEELEEEEEPYVPPKPSILPF